MADQRSREERRLRLGLIGVGHGGSELIPTFERSEEAELVAGADTNPEHLAALQHEHPEVRVYDSAEKLCADPDVDAVWIATPNDYHCEHTVLAARNGKHVICYKPMGTSVKEAAQMVEAANKHDVKLMIGGLHSFYGPFRAMRRIIATGQLGAVRAIHSLAYTDWMLLPRVPEEVDVQRGGGVVNRQAPHQVETIRFLGGGLVRSVRGYVGQWSSVRPCPGYYSASFDFEDGTIGSIVYNAYGYFVTAELVPWGNDRGIGGATPEERAGIRGGLLDGTGAANELRRKQALRMGVLGQQWMQQQRTATAEPWIPRHLGILVASCEKGDIRQSPYGLSVYDDDGNRDVVVEDNIRQVGRVELEEFYDAVVRGKPLFHDGAWGLATMEAHMAIIESAAKRREIRLTHQVRMAAGYDAG